MGEIVHEPEDRLQAHVRGVGLAHVVVVGEGTETLHRILAAEANGIAGRGDESSNKLISVF